MALPKIQTPTFKLKLPSTGREIKYRSFLVKEEKILLIAKESNDKKDMIDAFKQIVSNCAHDLDVDGLPLFDLEYVFLMIRAKSQNNIARVGVTDEEDKKEYTAFMDFDAVKIVKDPEHNPVIDLDGRVGVKMRYPTISDLEALDLFEDGALQKSNKVIELLKRCIDSVYDDDGDYPVVESTEEEQTAFFDSLTPGHIEKMQKFFLTFPVVVGTLEYVREDKKKVVREVRGAANFL